MTWFKVDDSFYRSRKVRRLGADRVPCVGLWTLCGDWSADNLTDGFVPWEIVEDWDEDRAWAKRLVGVDLWFEHHVDGEDGIQFHDWNDWNPTKSQVVAERSYNASKSALYRDPDLIETVRQRDSDRCRYCGAKVNWKDRRSAVGGTYDHVDATGQNNVSNLVVACRSCSAKKANKPLVTSGMTLLEPGAMGPTSTSTTKNASEHASSSYLDTATRSVPDPDPSRPVLKERTTSVTADASTKIDDDFDIWWAAWPRKVAKQAALKAYRSARRRKATAEQLLTVAADQVEAWRAAGKELEYIPHAASWLNGARYDDPVERPMFQVITNPDSPWAGYRIDTSDSPWAADMGRSS